MNSLLKQVVAPFLALFLAWNGAINAQTLKNRFSFDDATDSVGGTLATLSGGFASNGQFTLSSTTFISLPSNLLSGFTSVTIEVWASTGYNMVGNYARLFNVGPSCTSLSNSLQVMEYGPNGQFGVDFWTTTDNWMTIPSKFYYGNSNFHFALTITATTATLYLNGTYAGSMSSSVFIPSSACWYFGKSFNYGVGTSNNNAIASINEVRIWQGAMSASQVYASFFSGANVPTCGPGYYFSLTACTACPAGSYSTGAGLATSCVPVPAGAKEFNKGIFLLLFNVTIYSSLIPVGYYQPYSGQSSYYLTCAGAVVAGAANCYISRERLLSF